MTERALSFGAAATTYERHRLGYPDELADAVLGHAARRQLPAGERDSALAAVRAVLPERVEIIADLTLHLARRVRGVVRR